jgi:hypothetical protein
VLGIRFQRNQTAVRRKRSSEPDGGVCRERADLQHVPRTLEAGKEVEELPLVGSNTYLRKIRRNRRFKHGIENRIWRKDMLRDVPIDRGPQILAH